MDINSRVMLQWPTIDEDELREVGLGPLSIGTIVMINARDLSYEVMFDDGRVFPFSEDELVEYYGE